MKKSAPLLPDVSLKRCLTIQEAARYLSCHVYAIRRAVWAKQLAAVKIGHRYIFDRADLDAFFDQLKVAAS